MNAVTNFVAIASILLALATAGGAAKAKSGDEEIITPSKIVLNHNETMVNDATSVQRSEALSKWLMGLSVFIFNRVSSYARGGGVPGGCDDWGCGMNHNETIVSDATSTQQPDTWSQLLTSLRVFVFTRFSSYAPGGGAPGGCDDWGCGANHNETMVSDAAPVQQASIWSDLLISIQRFFLRPPSDPVDGDNHNETMLSDPAR